MVIHWVSDGGSASWVAVVLPSFEWFGACSVGGVEFGGGFLLL